MNIKAFFLSRKTTVSFFVLLLLSILIATLVPQKFIVSHMEFSKWQQAHPTLRKYSDDFGFDHVYSTTWFLLILVLAIFSLSLSSVEQYKVALQKTFRPPAIKRGDCVFIGKEPYEFAPAFKRRAYLFMKSSGERQLRYVKHPWGYWGNFLFHAGILMTMAVALFIALTYKSGRLNYVQGTIFPPDTPWLMEERGLLAGALEVPYAIRVDKITPEFYDNGRIKQITSEVSFLHSRSESHKLTVAMNSMLVYNGLRIYQTLDYGYAFTLEFILSSGEKRIVTLLLENPESPLKEGYGDFKKDWLPYILQAKYFTDVEKKTLWGENPLLTMRLIDGDKKAGQVTLRTGESGHLGEYQVRLVNVWKWTGLIFVGVKGTAGIFSGFFIIVLGAVLNYFTAPREINLVKDGEGYLLCWNAARFKDFYHEEYKDILKELGAEV